MKLEADVAPFDVQIRAGELVGVAGLEGQGQARFLRSLWGDAKVEGQVIRHTPKGEILIRNTSHAAAQGIAYVPRERALDSVFSWMSIRENFALPTLRQDCVWGLIRHRRSRERLEDYVRQLSIVMGDADDAITTLSGGNQQKVIIARWLASRPQVLLLNDPTRGVDINAKRDLYQLLLRLTEEGVAVVMLSTEVSEHVELMDRVLVFREGELWTEIPCHALTTELLVACYFGEKVDGHGSDR